MSECLLTPKEVAKRLSISRTHLYRIMGELQANGLQRVMVGNNAKYREASLDKIIQKSAMRQEPIASSIALKEEILKNEK